MNSTTRTTPAISRMKDARNLAKARLDWLIAKRSGNTGLIESLVQDIEEWDAEIAALEQAD